MQPSFNLNKEVSRFSASKIFVTKFGPSHPQRCYLETLYKRVYTLRYGAWASSRWENLFCNFFMVTISCNTRILTSHRLLFTLSTVKITYKIRCDFHLLFVIFLMSHFE